MLSAWGALLEAAVPKIPPSSSSSLRWELGLLQHESNQQASKRSEKAFERLRKAVREAEFAVLKHRCSYNPVTSIIEANCVQNIISLNFDLAIEHLLLKTGEQLPSYELNSGKTKNGPGKAKLERSKAKPVRHLESRRKIGSRVVWHPHGDRLNSAQPCLGIRQYALRTDAIESARCDFKGADQLNNSASNKPRNWVELMMSTHVIFFGTSLDFSEWDVWFALVNRWRNYAKLKSKKSEPHSFLLTTGDKHAGLPSQITRLSAPSYDQGWKWLDAVMNCPTSASIDGAN